MFRKLLDQGEAGDNVGLLLRGIDKNEIKRGMISFLSRIPDHVAIGFTPQHTKQIYTLLKRIILLIVLLII